MTNKILPGAEKFSRYLEDMLGDALTIEGPEDLEIGGPTRWEVKYRGKKLGDYRMYSQKGEEGEVVCLYNGMIPDKSELSGFRQVRLGYYKWKYVSAGIGNEKREYVQETPWQRQDRSEE